MAKMDKESNLLVTFSKRRAGLLKKASELCTLFRVQIAIIVFSPGKKVFSFGHPSVELIVDLYLIRKPNPNFSNPLLNNASNNVAVEAHQSAKIRDLNAEVMEVCAQLEVERKKGEALYKMRKMNQTKLWWENDISKLCLPQLQQLQVALQSLKIDVGKEAEKRITVASTSSQIIPHTEVDYNHTHAFVLGRFQQLLISFHHKLIPCHCQTSPSSFPFFLSVSSVTLTGP